MRLRATVSIRNEAMIAARKRLGLTQKALAELADVNVGAIGALESLNFKSAYVNTSTCFEKVDRVAGALDLNTDDVMPRELVGQAVETTRSVVTDVSPTILLESVQAMRSRLIACAPSDHIETESFREFVRSVVDELPQRARTVIKMRYGIGCPTSTLEEVADRLRLSRERVRQIELKAIRDLQHPNVANRLRAGNGESTGVIK